MSRYCISDHCRWVKGDTGSAIYDLKKGIVYPFDHEGTALIEQMLHGYDPSETSVAFVSDLIERHLLNDHDFPIAEKRILPSLRYVWLELTNICNCRCIHCYGAFGIPDNSKSKEKLTLEDWKRILDRIASLGGDSIQFIGGEPLMFPGFMDLLRYANSLSFRRIDIFTNAFFLTESVADLIADVGASVRVSLYGYDESSHDAITQHSGSFKRLDHSLDLLKERNIPVSIAVVLMRENQDNIQQIKDYVEKKGFMYRGFDTVRKVNHSIQNSHTVTDPSLLSERMIKKPKFQTSPYLFSLCRQWNSCWYGKFAVTASGDIIPCIFARDLICGNIHINSFESIREKLIDYWSITKDKVNECSVCEFRYACDDCRPLSLGEGKGLLGKYPRCLYDPLSCQWQTMSTNGSWISADHE